MNRLFQTGLLVLFLIGSNLLLMPNAGALVCSDCDDKQNDSFEAYRNTSSLLYQDLDHRVLKIEMLIYGCSVAIGLLISLVVGPWIKKRYFSIVIVMVLTLALLTISISDGSCQSCEQNPCFNNQQCSLGCSCLQTGDAFRCVGP